MIPISGSQLGMHLVVFILNPNPLRLTLSCVYSVAAKLPLTRRDGVAS